MLFPSFATADFSGRVRVIDGDTFDVGTVRVRIHGIDAPEKDQRCVTEQGVKWACGKWVTDQVRQLAQGRNALCTQIAVDRYERVVARCKISGVDIGELLVHDGFAYAYRKYSMDYDLIEKEAAVNDRGIHDSRVQSPSQFRITRAKGRFPLDRNCVIKGNISVGGKRIFHAPGQAYYERTGIRLEKGERWFCSAQQAVDAGWRAARH